MAVTGSGATGYRYVAVTPHGQQPHHPRIGLSDIMGFEKRFGIVDIASEGRTIPL